MLSKIKDQGSGIEDGFTLIEMIIYSALLALFLAASFAFVTSLLGATDTSFERNEVVANQELVERKLRWVMGQASRVDIPAVNGSSTTEVRITGSQASTSPASFTLGGGQIALALAGAAPVMLTNYRVNVTSFVGEHFSNSQSTSTLKIFLALESAVFPNIKSSTTFFYALPR